MSVDKVELPKDELFAMLDIANEMIGFCSGQMAADRYNAVANAIWVIANRAAGDDATADRLKDELARNRASYSSALEKADQYRGNA